MNEKVIKIIKNRDFLVPATLILNYKKLKIKEVELILLIYLINDNEQLFNPKKISKALSWELKDVLELMNSLVDKDLLKIEVKREKNIHEEYINLDYLFKKLSLMIINEENDEKLENNNIFDNFEKEFGRPLSPIEYEIINGWQTNKISEELILLALKEAVYNGALNLRYIDRILFDWTKKGIKNKEDVENSRIKFISKKKQELFDYDWLNEKEDK